MALQMDTGEVALVSNQWLHRFDEEEESASPLWATPAGSLALCSDGFAPRVVTDGSDSPPSPPTTNYYQDYQYHY